jgi:hypothetical protein
MLQNTLDSIPEFWTICAVAQQMGHSAMGGMLHSLENYKALPLSTADAYDANHNVKWQPSHTQCLHAWLLVCLQTG